MTKLTEKPMPANSNLHPVKRMHEMLADEMLEMNDVIHAEMQSEHAPRIPQVTEHLINAGGKRLRPMLTIAAAKLCNYQGIQHINLAATVEFIHTATLLHDDVVDESTRRRGQKTANLLWDNKSSVLVGDYLFSRAFQLMVRTENLQVLDILANASATIAEGEVIQLGAVRNIDLSEDVYFQIIRGKTAALFSAATEVGAIIADETAEKTNALRIYGDALGINFQIIDDLLDYQGSASAIGKNIGDDFREGKLTLPLIYAMQDASPSEREFWTRVIKKGQYNEGDLEECLRYIENHNGFERCREQSIYWANTAKSALDPFEDSEMKSCLTDLCDYLVDRVI